MHLTGEIKGIICLIICEVMAEMTRCSERKRIENSNNFNLILHLDAITNSILQNEFLFASFLFQLIAFVRYMSYDFSVFEKQRS